MVSCAFHLSQALIRRLGTNSLKTVYNTVNEFKEWFRLVMAMSHVPPDDVRQLWTIGFFEIPADLQLQLGPAVVQRVAHLMDGIHVGVRQCAIKL